MNIQQAAIEEADDDTVDAAPFFIQGELVEGNEHQQRSRDLGVTFATPKLDLDRLVQSRLDVPPLLNVPLSEIIDFLVEAGKRLADPDNPHVRACIDRMAKVSLAPRSEIEIQMLAAAYYLDAKVLRETVEQNFPDPRALDEWIAHTDHQGRRSFIRAFAPRLLHVLPGNSPAMGVRSIAQAALVKATNLFKMPSADPFSTVAFLRTMAEIDAGHPVVRSMTAVYWRGGDEKIERVLFRPQYFDKIVAWGGGDAIGNVMKYIGPGLQLISFDPKTSISMVGREVFESEDRLNDAAERNAMDVSILNQEACVCSRFTFIEAEEEQADRYCEILAERIRSAGAEDQKVRPLASDLRDEIETLEMLDDDYRVFGKTDGRGVVIRSDEPVDFHPLQKTANVVCVDSLEKAARFVNVATQTVGVYPFDRIPGLRDNLASAGAQRVVRLGEAGPSAIGNPHDAMYPLHRFVHWMAHEDGVQGDEG